MYNEIFTGVFGINTLENPVFYILIYGIRTQNPLNPIYKKGFD
jgi:hypothetical protein